MHKFSVKNELVDIALFIARRTAHPTPGEKPGVMERIAVVAVALSLAVMIVALAVVAGFKHEVGHRLSGLSSHVVLTDIRGVDAIDPHAVVRSERTERIVRSMPGFVSMAPYALRGGVVRTDAAVETVMLKGVDSTFDWRFFGEWLVAGGLPRVGGGVRTKDLLLSQTLADRLDLGVDDRVEMLFVGGERPRRDRFRVAGIYASGMDELDAALALTDLRNVARLSDWGPDEISGYEIVTTDLASADAFAEELDERLFLDDDELTANLAATSVVALYPHVFDWLRAHDVNAAVILGVMLLVAFFNMASALLILVLERTRTIGLLKALGMADPTLRRLFLYRAAFVALRGLAWGNAAGLALCLTQRWSGLVRLSAEGYVLSELPVRLEWGWWLALNAGTLAAIVVLLVIPAHVISSVKPDQTIRYE